MLLGRYNEQGKIEFEHVPDLPSDYTCPEWKAYDAAVDAANGVDLDDAEQRRTYTAYHNAMQARANRGDYEDILDPADEEEEPVQSRGGFWGFFRR
jgi:hypothetical protein